MLFERCVIACALYEEFWQKYIAYLKKQSVDAARSVYERACGVHLQKKPTIHVEWAAFEESLGNTAKAVSVLTELQSSFPDLLLISTRLIGLYRRKQDKPKGEWFLAPDSCLGSEERFWPRFHCLSCLVLSLLLTLA